mgnify:CR=1
MVFAAQDRHDAQELPGLLLVEHIACDSSMASIAHSPGTFSHKLLLAMLHSPVLAVCCASLYLTT